MQILRLSPAACEELYHTALPRDFPAAELKPFAEIQRLLDAGVYEPLLLTDDAGAPDTVDKFLVSPDDATSKYELNYKDDKLTYTYTADKKTAVIKYTASKLTNPTTGTRSRGASTWPQTSQWERPRRTLSPWTMRQAAQLRKLPMQAPSRAAMKQLYMVMAGAVYSMGRLLRCGVFSRDRDSRQPSAVPRREHTTGDSAPSQRLAGTGGGKVKSAG